MGVCTREQRGAEGQYSWTEVRSRWTWTCGSRSERRSPNPGREQPTALGRPPATTPWKAGRDKASKPESRGWGRNPPRGERAEPVYERGGLGAHQEYSQRASGGSQGLPYTQKGRWRGVGEPERQTMGRGAQMGRGLEAFPTTQRQYRRSKGPEVSSTRQWQYQAQYAQNTHRTVGPALRSPRVVSFNALWTPQRKFLKNSV